MSCENPIRAWRNSHHLNPTYGPDGVTMRRPYEGYEKTRQLMRNFENDPEAGKRAKLIEKEAIAYWVPPIVVQKTESQAAAD